MNSIYVVQSQDSFLVEKKVEEIKKAHQIEPESVSQYDLSEHTLDQVLEDLDTYSLLTFKKCIIMTNPSFLTAEGTKISESLLTHFEQYLDHPNPDHILIILLSKLDERKKIGKKLKKVASCCTLTQDAFQYAKEALDEYQLESGAIPLLVDYCNENISKLHQECEKLKLFCLDQKMISKSDIKTLVEKEIDDSDQTVFSFVNALIEKDKKESLRIYHDLLKLGLDPIAILAMVANQFRFLYQVKGLLQEQKRKDEIAQLLDCHPYRVEKAKINGRSYQEQELLDYLTQLANLDLKIKTGQVNSEEAFLLFILEMK